MNEPIAVADALLLVELALEDCDKATPGPWTADLDMFDETMDIEALVTNDTVSLFARMVTPHRNIKAPVWDEKAPWGDEEKAFSAASWKAARESQEIKDARFMVLSRGVMRPLVEVLSMQIRYKYDPENDSAGRYDHVYPPLAALRDHYDKTRPDWRTIK